MRSRMVKESEMTRLANEMDLEPDSFWRVLVSVDRSVPAEFDPC